MTVIDVSGNENLMTISTAQTGKEAKASVITKSEKGLRYRTPKLRWILAEIGDDEEVTMEYTTSKKEPWLTLEGITRHPLLYSFKMECRSNKFLNFTEDEIKSVVEEVSKRLDRPEQEYRHFQLPKKNDDSKWMAMFPEGTDMLDLDIFCGLLKKDGFVVCKEGIKIYNLKDGNWTRVV